MSSRPPQNHGEFRPVACKADMFISSRVNRLGSRGGPGAILDTTFASCHQAVWENFGASKGPFILIRFARYQTARSICCLLSLLLDNN